MSLKKIFLKNYFTYKLYIYYNLYIRNKALIKRKNYSQWGEDIFIEKYFINRKKGFYVDIGCFHPIMYSNTCLLFNKGWSGINIDLNKTSIDLYNIIRPKDFNICAAISNFTEESELFFDHHFSPVNTINKFFYDTSNKKIAFKNMTKRKIKTQSFDSIVKKISNLPQINFLNIDCEGSDYSVLQSFNLKKYQPDLICVETKDSAGKSNKDSNNIFEYLRKNNYNFIKQCGPSSFFQKVHSTGA